MNRTPKAAVSSTVGRLVLPCPFCGAFGESVEVKESYGCDQGVLCHGCGVWMPSRVSTEPGRSHGALEMWNRRQNIANAAVEARRNAVASDGLLADESKGKTK